MPAEQSRRRPVAALVALAALAAAAPAWGYVRSRVPKGCRPLSDDPVNGCVEVAWSRTDTSCVPVTIYLNGFAEMTPDEVARALGAAAHAWSPSMVTCPTAGRTTHPFIEIVPGMAAANAKTPPVANDARNVVVFQLEDVVDPSIIALTTLSNKKDGRILDADVEINAFWWDFANLDPGSSVGGSNGQPDPFDLQAAITHEFGHFLGLGHTCFAGVFGSDPEVPIDHLGNEVPTCDKAPAEVEATVMFAVVDHADVRKRTLTDDDIAGVCAIYPEADDPRICRLDLPDDGCGCATGGALGGAAATALTLAVFAVLARVRTGRARRAGRGPTPPPAPTPR